jgi:acyl transferase domain-containing protein
MIGHSIGEFVAACLAGVFSLDDAIAIVAERGRLMQSLPGGSMISLPMKEAEAHNLIAQLEVECPNLSLAVVNAPELCAVSGPDDEIDTLIRSLEDQEVEYRRLHTSHAFHSPMMEPILTSFAQYVEQVELAEPEIPFISNVTGTWITPEEATDPHYWALHLRNTVRFSKGIETLYEDPSWIFIEIGPGRTLSTLTRAVMTAISSESLAQAAGQGNVIQTVRHPRTQGPDHAFLLNAMGRLWLAGVNINWEAYYINGYRKRIPLPTYPFQRQRYWIEPDQSLSQYISSKNKAGDLIKRSDLNEWFYLPSWKRLNLISDSSTNTDSADWLLFIDPGQNNDWEAELHTRLVELNQNVTVVEMGDRFASKEKGRFVINPGESSDYSTLIGELKSSDSIPSFVLHMWGFSDTYETESKINANAPFEDYELGYISLLNFAKAINEHAVYDQIQFGVLTNNTQDIYGSEKINPNQAPVVGLSRVVSQEIPNLICRSIDLVPELVNSGQNGRITNRIILELIEQPSERIVAYRGNHRWVQLYEPIRYNIPDPGDRIPTRLREEGVYLITGGLGRIGLTLADYLARKVRARIILVDRFARSFKECIRQAPMY